MAKCYEEGDIRIYVPWTLPNVYRSWGPSITGEGVGVAEQGINVRAGFQAGKYQIQTVRRMNPGMVKCRGQSA